MGRNYIVSHTSIRGIAALGIVVYHCQFGRVVHLPIEVHFGLLDHAYLFVDLFFILSGFVICHAYRAEPDAAFDRAQIDRFWVHRFARIYPLHLFALLMVVGCWSLVQAPPLDPGELAPPPTAWSRDDLAAFVEQLFLLNAWGLTGRVAWNIPTWSISAEVVAYLLFPAVVALLARARRATLAAMLLFPILFYGWVGTGSGDLNIVKGAAILRCLAGFSLGMLLHGRRRDFAALSDRTLGWLQVAGLGLAMATLAFGGNDIRVIPAFVLLIGATAPDRGLLCDGLRARPLRWLGDISYSIYLNHFWVLGLWGHALAALRARGLFDAASPSAFAFTLAGGVALVLLVSHVTYHAIERPARRLIVARWETRRGSAARSTLRAGKRPV